MDSTKETEKVMPTKTMMRQTGCPIAHSKNSMTAGPTGGVMVQDIVLLEKIEHFTREKIPARNVHALGVGAYGTFTVTNDISKWTCAKLFSDVGKTTPLFTRFSGIFTEQGDADTSRDPRGFALKFYTEEGNWDLMGINTPVFNLRDAKIGPDAIHAFKRDPRTGMWYPTQSWDFVTTHPESLHQVMMLYTDRSGTPLSFRYMHAYGCHTFSLVNDKNERFWVKFHILAQNGAKGFSRKDAMLVAGQDPNFLGRDLRESLDRGDYPRWKLCCQIMPEEEGYKHPWTFDPTKVWKHKDYPLIDIGIIEINRNVIDYFSEVEQVAFSPRNLVPGIGLSPDKLLQGRLLIYDDAQYHRIGPNYRQLPINRPNGVPELNTPHVGGNMNLEIKNHFPHYYPSNFGGLQPDPSYLEPPFKTGGPSDFYDWPGEGSDEDYYGQPAELFRVLKDEDKLHLCDNIATSLEKVDPSVTKKVLFHLRKINQGFGDRVESMLNDRLNGTAKLTEGELLVKRMTQTLLGDISYTRK